MTSACSLLTASLCGTRKNNEDALGASRLSSDPPIWAILIVDGMGGIENGEEAAKVCRDKIFEAARDMVESYGKHLFYTRHSLLLKTMLEDLHAPTPCGKGMAAFALLLFCSQRFYNGYRCLTAWAGDCRLWHMDVKAQLTQLTEDDHDAEGRITAWYDGASGKIVGTSHTSSFTWARAPLVLGATTDGVHEKCDMEELGSFMRWVVTQSNIDFEQSLASFLEANLSDNATAVFLLHQRQLPKRPLAIRQEENVS